MYFLIPLMCKKEYPTIGSEGPRLYARVIHDSKLLILFNAPLGVERATVVGNGPPRIR